jgi:hypothetical protein
VMTPLPRPSVTPLPAYACIAPSPHPPWLGALRRLARDIRSQLGKRTAKSAPRAGLPEEPRR